MTRAISGRWCLGPPKELRDPHGHGIRDRYVAMYMNLMFERERNYSSIWEERGPDAAAMQTLSAPETRRWTWRAAAYADFAKAYQSAFEMEYSLSEATPEGYMNALLGMARAFARAGDAERAPRRLQRRPQTLFA